MSNNLFHLSTEAWLEEYENMKPMDARGLFLCYNNVLVRRNRRYGFRSKINWKLKMSEDNFLKRLSG